MNDQAIKAIEEHCIRLVGDGGVSADGDIISDDDGYSLCKALPCPEIGEEYPEVCQHAEDIAAIINGTRILLAALKERDAEIERLTKQTQADWDAAVAAAAETRTLLAEKNDTIAALRSRCEKLESVREAAEAYCTASRALEVATEDDWPIKDKIPLGMDCGAKVTALRSALSAAKEGA